MNKIILVFVIVTVIHVVASPAEQCKGQYTEGLQKRIRVHPCGEKMCELVRGTNTTVSIKFLATNSINDLTNDVYAKLGEFPLPFIGVYGTSACNNIVHAEDNTPAKCPLEANKEYIYVNTFYMKQLYPLLPKIRVYWALKNGSDIVICFEIPAKIVKKEKKCKTT